MINTKKIQFSKVNQIVARFLKRWNFFFLLAFTSINYVVFALQYIDSPMFSGQNYFNHLSGVSVVMNINTLLFVAMLSLFNSIIFANRPLSLWTLLTCHLTLRITDNTSARVHKVNYGLLTLSFSKPQICIYF